MRCRDSLADADPGIRLPRWRLPDSHWGLGHSGAEGHSGPLSRAGEGQGEGAGPSGRGARRPRVETVLHPETPRPSPRPSPARERGPVAHCRRRRCATPMGDRRGQGRRQREGPVVAERGVSAPARVPNRSGSRRGYAPSSRAPPSRPAPADPSGPGRPARSRGRRTPLPAPAGGRREGRQAPGLADPEAAGGLLRGIRLRVRIRRPRADPRLRRHAARPADRARPGRHLPGRDGALAPRAGLPGGPRPGAALRLRRAVCRPLGPAGDPGRAPERAGRRRSAPDHRRRHLHGHRLDAGDQPVDPGLGAGGRPREARLRGGQCRPQGRGPAGPLRAPVPGRPSRARLGPAADGDERGRRRGLPGHRRGGPVRGAARCRLDRPVRRRPGPALDRPQPSGSVALRRADARARPRQPRRDGGQRRAGGRAREPGRRPVRSGRRPRPAGDRPGRPDRERARHGGGAPRGRPRRGAAARPLDGPADRPGRRLRPVRALGADRDDRPRARPDPVREDRPDLHGRDRPARRPVHAGPAG